MVPAEYFMTVFQFHISNNEIFVLLKHQHQQNHQHHQQEQQTVYLHVHPDVRDTRRGQLEGVVVRAEAVAADASVKLLFRLREQIQQNTCYL